MWPLTLTTTEETARPSRVQRLSSLSLLSPETVPPAPSRQRAAPGPGDRSASAGCAPPTSAHPAETTRSGTILDSGDQQAGAVQLDRAPHTGSFTGYN